MTNEEIFHQVATRLGYGPRLAREKLAGTPAGNGYAQVAEEAETLIASAKQFLLRVPQIHFDFVLNGTVNAFTFKENDQYFIGITTGAIVLLSLVLNRILADRRLLPDVGIPGSEASDLPPLVGLIPEAQRMYEAGTLNPIRPRTEARSGYASHLFFQAILFLVGHEIAHISLGHVDYLSSKTSTPILPEIGWNQSSSVGRIERQALELSADARSMHSRLHSAHLTATTSPSQVPIWLTSPLSFTHTLFDCAFAINVLFRIFGDVRFVGSDLSSASYPPLPLRRAFLMLFAVPYVQSVSGPQHKDTAMALFQRAIFSAESAIATITGQTLSSGGLQDAATPEAFQHLKLLQDCWDGHLRQELAPFAYEQDPVPPPFLGFAST